MFTNDDFLSIAKLPDIAISAYTFHEIIYPAYLISKLSKRDFVKTLNIESLLTPQYKTIRGIVSAAKTLLKNYAENVPIPELLFRMDPDLIMFCKKHNVYVHIIHAKNAIIPVLIFRNTNTTTPILKRHEACFPHCNGSLERLIQPVV